MRGMFLLAVGVVVVGCPRSEKPTPAKDSARLAPVVVIAADAAARDAGVETASDIAATRREAEKLTQSLLAGGIAAHEVTSIADIRGVRLMRKRKLRQALVWFEVGAETDPTFEPCLFNGARAAAKAGEQKLASRYLALLQALQTPLSKRKMKAARGDPELKSLAESLAK